MRTGECPQITASKPTKRRSSVTPPMKTSLLLQAVGGRNGGTAGHRLGGGACKALSLERAGVSDGRRPAEDDCRLRVVLRGEPPGSLPKLPAKYSHQGFKELSMWIKNLGEPSCWVTSYGYLVASLLLVNVPYRHWLDWKTGIVRLTITKKEDRVRRL
ncbi:unnamed protein product [Ectocarpus sp. 12 AP-2014]